MHCIEYLILTTEQILTMLSNVEYYFAYSMKQSSYLVSPENSLLDIIVKDRRLSTSYCLYRVMKTYLKNYPKALSNNTNQDIHTRALLQQENNKSEH